MALFGKDQTPSQPASSTARGGDVASRTGGSFIGPNLVFDGTLTGNEDVLVEGSVRGKVNLESNLRVGKNARVEASVHAKTVTVEGVLIGDISADAKVELIATARVDGNIKAPKIIVAEGAKFKGAVDMGSVESRKDATQANQTKEKDHVGNRDGK